MRKDLSDFLIGLKKEIVENGNILSRQEMLISGIVNFRWKLYSREDPDQEFLLDVKESEKKAFSLSLHHQDDVSKAGIIRVDYHGRHRNPVEVLDTVPAEFIPYAGIYLDEWPAHIHYNIDGYSSLAWAIPLSIDSFPVKDISSIGEVAAAIKAFCNLINVVTPVTINHQMQLI